MGFHPSDDEELDESELYGDYEELEIDDEDADVLDKFLPSAPKERRTLADMIMDKINEKNAADERKAGGVDGKEHTNRMDEENSRLIFLSLSL